MDREATMNGTTEEDLSAHALAQRLAGVGHDILSIAELQMQLLQADLQAWRRAAVRGGGMGTSAVILALSAVPTAMIGLGMWIAELTEISTGGAILLVALAAVIVAGALVIAARRQFDHQQGVFDRSKKQLHANLGAIRQSLSDFAGRPGSD